MAEKTAKKHKKIIVAFKIVDENGNDITPENVMNSVETDLCDGVDVTYMDCTNITRVLSTIFNRIGEKTLIRHLFPRNPRKVPTELCNNDPDKFSYFVAEYRWSHTKF